MDKKKLVIGVIGADVHAVGISIFQQRLKQELMELWYLHCMDMVSWIVEV